MSLKVDTSGLNEVRVALLGIKNGFPKVASRAINKTETGLRTIAVREISKQLNLTKTRIRKDFEMRRATYRNLKGAVVAVGYPINLVSYIGTTQTAKGVSARIWVNGKRVLYKHGFLGKMKRKDGTTYKAAFWRKWNKFRTQRRPGPIPEGIHKEDYTNPIHPLVGPTIEYVYEKPAVMGTVMRGTDRLMTKKLDHELEYFMSKL